MKCRKKAYRYQRTFTVILAVILLSASFTGCGSTSERIIASTNDSVQSAVGDNSTVEEASEKESDTTAVAELSQQTEYVSLESKRYRYNTETGMEYLWHESTYDSAGRRTSSVYYNKDGSTGTAYQLTYDSAGFALTVFDDEVIYFRAAKHTFDDAGKVIRSDYFDDSEILTGYCEYSYDSNGKMESSTEYDDDGNITGYAL